MKYLLVFILVVFVAESLALLVHLKNNINEKELLFIAKVRNYITADNKVNTKYIRKVLKQCYKASEEDIENFIEECDVEESFPEKTAVGLYHCVARETSEEHLDDSKKIKHQSGLCQLKLINFIKNGKINQEVAVKKLVSEGENVERARRIVTKCSVDKATPEDTANNFIVCLDKEYNLTI